MDRYNPETPASELPLGERFTEGYDGLGRLISSALSKQVAGTAALQPWRTDTWALDVHGHWAGAIAGQSERYGRSTTNADGLRQVQLDNGTTRTIAWSGMAAHVDQTIGASWTGTAGQTAGQAEVAGFKIDAVEDGAGNVRFCGELLYAFDAWNRLVAVWKARRVDHATVLPSASAPLAGVEVGNWVKRLRYDALGRLIEVVSPMAGPDWPNEGGKLERVERFWYDGSRRIQEVVIDPTDLLYVVHKYGTEGLVEYITTGLVNAETGPPTGVPFRALNREYIWGMGMGGGVDELHVFFDRDRRPWGVLQDSDGDNVAITNDGGDVVAEFVYDPYGAVIGQRSYGVHPPLKAGHRGLFAESLTVGTVGTPDADLGDPIETAAAWVDGRVLVPNERVVYHMRNRVYDPGPSGATAGRFIQRDPNASGAVLYGGGGGLGSHGAAPVAVVTGLDLAAHVADGVNTYGYLRGSPRGAGDPDGLRWDPFDDMADDYLATSAAQQAAFMGQINAGFNTTAHIAWQLAQVNPVIGMAASIHNISSGDYTYWDFVNLLPVVGSAGKAVNLLAGTHHKMRVVQAAYGSNRAAMLGRQMQKGKTTLTLTDEMVQHIGKILPYNQAKQLTKGTASALEAHHIIPRRFMKLVPGLTDDTVPAVVMAYEDHRGLERVIRDAATQFGREPANAADLKLLLENAYQNYPEFVSAMRSFLP